LEAGEERTSLPFFSETSRDAEESDVHLCSSGRVREVLPTE